MLGACGTVGISPCSSSSTRSSSSRSGAGTATRRPHWSRCRSPAASGLGSGFRGTTILARLPDTGQVHPLTQSGVPDPSDHPALGVLVGLGHLLLEVLPALLRRRGLP